VKLLPDLNPHPFCPHDIILSSYGSPSCIILLLYQVPSGWLSDRYGGKHVFGTGMLVSGVASLLIPVATRIHYGLLIALRLIMGIGTVRGRGREREGERERSIHYGLLIALRLIMGIGTVRGRGRERDRERKGGRGRERMGETERDREREREASTTVCSSR
jgi:hypothetical protein